MPELPEVETTRRGIEPYLCNRKVTGVIVRDRRLRWPVPENLPALLEGKLVLSVERRGKYLLIQFADGAAIIHLGMSGNLRIVDAGSSPQKHDHIDIVLEGGRALRYTDPRRFGCVLWQEGEVGKNKLLASLGPEPLGEQFDGPLLFKRSRRRKVPVKTFIMDSKVVVGVGNIYANEALYAARIRPDREAGGISAKRYAQLVVEIKQVLYRAIESGGTTLKDYVGGDGKPGYFKQELQVYGRGGEACVSCGKKLTEIRINQRSTVFCRNCQR